MRHVANAIALLIPLAVLTHLIVTLAERSAPAPARKARAVTVRAPELDPAERPREASGVAGVSTRPAPQSAQR